DELVAQLSEDILDGWSPDASLLRMLREGVPGRFSGLDALKERLRRLRAEQESRGRLDGPLDEVRQRLTEVLDIERLELAADDRPDARFQELVLEALPDSPAQAINELRGYDFASEAAREAFESLLADLRRQVMDASFRQISEALQDPSPEDMRRLKDMLADLNGLLDERSEGTGPSQAAFDEFMARHGDFFPEAPETLDELLEALAQRAASFSRFMASLSPEQQAEMRDLMDGMLDDMDLQFQLDQLGRSLRDLAPDLGWDRPTDMAGSGDMGLADALNAIEDLSATENLERSIEGDYPGATLEDVDIDELERMLGLEAKRDFERLRQIEKALEQAGVVMRSRGRLELTPRGVRKMGERALAKVFERITADRPGSHDLPEAGGVGEPTGTSRSWVFGDAFRLDLRRTVQNAVLRQGPTQGPLSLHPDDFEVEEQEMRTAVATVLLLDMSRSMPLRGHWVGAKRMALALHTLITTAFPEDTLEIVAFSDYARVMRPADLAVVDWEPVYGTNMEHAFSLAGRILSRHRDSSKQVLLVTDGEPTAHLEGEHVFFQWPPAGETIDRTFREAMRLAKSGVTMNIFMLEQDPGLVGFIDRLASIVHGRVFAVQSAELGDMVVRDYLRR
ncbi:MAG: hypothetical protein OEO77_08185, partial [Acidimicrobiia bacterium]|nr:hypothetical protein [Acidimicrobiia bacterium]